MDDQALSVLNEANKDSARLEWIMPLFELTELDQEEKDNRLFFLASEIMKGKTGREAIDLAME